jgi:hypothetical protein
MRFTRRNLLKTLTAGAGSLAVPGWIRPAFAGSGKAERIIFFYFPDGVPGPSEAGEASLFHCTGSEYDFSMPELLDPLVPWRDQCLFFQGLSMGATDSGSHPGGAKKLLTAADYGYYESIDQHLARTVGADSPWRHLYLGAQANYNNASGDQHISYPSSGVSITPEDDPRRAFESLFGGAASGEVSDGPDPTQVSVLDGVFQEMGALEDRLGGLEKEKLEFHLESLYELEGRVLGAGGSGGASCKEPDADISGITDDNLYAPETFPDILKAQIDIMVLAMECGMTRVGTVQCSMHTSELIMSRWPGTEMYQEGYDMRSHQASHYGASHDWSKAEFSHYVGQRRWFISQFAYLLEQLAARPEGDGTMLDNSIVVLLTEVCDGNLHYHDDMPFLVAGGAGGAIRTGRFLQTGYARHADLWIALAQAMGDDLWSFGDYSTGPLSGVLG